MELNDFDFGTTMGFDFGDEMQMTFDAVTYRTASEGVSRSFSNFGLIGGGGGRGGDNNNNNNNNSNNNNNNNNFSNTNFGGGGIDRLQSDFFGLGGGGGGGGEFVSTGSGIGRIPSLFGGAAGGLDHSASINNNNNASNNNSNNNNNNNNDDINRIPSKFPFPAVDVSGETGAQAVEAALAAVSANNNGNRVERIADAGNNNSNNNNAAAAVVAAAPAAPAAAASHPPPSTGRGRGRPKLDGSSKNKNADNGYAAAAPAATGAVRRTSRAVKKRVREDEVEGDEVSEEDTSSSYDEDEDEDDDDLEYQDDEKDEDFKSSSYHHSSRGHHASNAASGGGSASAAASAAPPAKRGRGRPPGSGNRKKLGDGDSAPPKSRGGRQSSNSSINIHGNNNSQPSLDQRSHSESLSLARTASGRPVLELLKWLSEAAQTNPTTVNFQDFENKLQESLLDDPVMEEALEIVQEIKKECQLYVTAFCAPPPLQRMISQGGRPYPEAGELEVCSIMCIADLTGGQDTIINLEQFYDKCDVAEREFGIIGIVYNGQSKGDISIPKRQFGAQVQVKVVLPVNPNVIVKVFKTGKLHLTGCKDLTSAVEAVDYVFAAITQATKDDVTSARPVITCGSTVGCEGLVWEKLANKEDCIQVVNANCTFDTGFSQMGFNVELDRVADEFRKEEYSGRVISVIYGNGDGAKKAQYPGCKIYLKRRANVVPGIKMETTFVGVFTSGKTIISGSPTLEEARNAYEFVKNVLSRAYERIRFATETKKSRKNH